MQYVTFTDNDKIEFFDEISSHFYNANFGTLSKSEFELIMFRFYLEKLVEHNKEDDGTIDYSKCSDYKISKDLGITQQRVRNLKIKNQLVNPITYDWKKALAKLITNARYDKVSQKVTLNIPDPNLYVEIQNFIEDNGAYIEKQLNSKILQMRAEYFVDLIVFLEKEDNKKEIIKSSKKLFKEKNKNNTVFDDKEIGRSLANASVDILSVVESLSSIISPGNDIGVAFINMIKKYFNKL